MFSLFMKNDTFDLLFDGYDKKYIAAGKDSEGYGIHWFDVHNQKDIWSLELQDARYGYMSFLKGTAKRALLATGERFIHIPQEDLDYLGGLW